MQNKQGRLLLRRKTLCCLYSTSLEHYKYMGTFGNKSLSNQVKCCKMASWDTEIGCTQMGQKNPWSDSILEGKEDTKRYIQVWNWSTGNCCHIKPFSQAGSLITCILSMTESWSNHEGFEKKGDTKGIDLYEVLPKNKVELYCVLITVQIIQKDMCCIKTCINKGQPVPMHKWQHDCSPLYDSYVILKLTAFWSETRMSVEHVISYSPLLALIADRCQITDLKLKALATQALKYSSIHTHFSLTFHL